MQIIIKIKGNLESPCAALVCRRDSHPTLLICMRQYPPHPVMSLILTKNECEYRVLPLHLLEGSYSQSFPFRRMPSIPIKLKNSKCIEEKTYRDNNV